MRILITGGAGYVGCELVRALTNQHQVEHITVYDNLSRGNYNFFLGESLPSGKVTFVMGELLDSRRLRKELTSADTVFHLAAKVTTPFSNIDGHSYEQTNHWGTAELVYALEESDVKHIIFLSSTGVYGSTTHPADEQTPPNPDSFYGISKFRAEQHVQRLYSKMKTHIIRLGNVYGFSRCMRFDAVINRIMFDAHYAGRITINGTGKQQRSFIHINKAAGLLSRLPFSELPNGIYNAVDKTLSILEIVEAVKKLYPDLESFFINQHYAAHTLEVKHSSLLNGVLRFNDSILEDELMAFKNQFSFN
jgi:UDP-glucose 4-epimerase